MISETLAEGLERYRIGPKIRTLRKAKKLGLVQLGEHSGLSPGLLSKIERGQIVPTLPTLLRIALVFGVGLEHFFAPEDTPEIAVARRADRLRLPDRPGKAPPSYFFESLDFPAADPSMDAYLAEFPAGAPPSEPHEHEGVELVYLIRGRLAVEIGERTVELAEGDAVHFDSGIPHRYRAAGEPGATAIVVVHDHERRAGAGSGRTATLADSGRSR
jgi:transcriptional regulator with XRE-family HTH domain